MPRRVRKERRWALEVDLQGKPTLLGPFCWDSGTCWDQPRTRTFQTRLMAREERETCSYHNARVVSVVVTFR